MHNITWSNSGTSRKESQRAAKWRRNVSYKQIAMMHFPKEFKFFFVQIMP